ncbi:PREDICTED: probable LRR receptor-like serine/threonine-protein kinase At4g29180 [Camelina sativa]|uniref:Probable LRR receptor-like serine/threonine-protein kinase At4g29180 n=1 Tax=Camelina sativa TaxID=90675 RepID=A0ABM1QKN0_CAMSA|nr:PREDICTED: probable LRR receptor-like serine/threonine-protein kinase At4g29180 [Camelina sativa]
MEAHSVFLILFGVIATAIVVDGQGQAGFISIDCGAPPNINYVDTDTGISYTWDAPFINAGVNVNVSEEYGCHSHLLLLNPSELRLLKFRNASENVVKEILSFAESDTLYICLVNKGKGTPFISALELRPMNSSIYGTEFGRNVSLVLYRRWDTGYLNGTGRYQKDTYDGIWSPYSPVSWNSTMTTGYIDIFQSGYRPPDEVIKTAASPKSDDEPLELSWTSGDPDTRFYAYLYFVELENLKRNESRKIKIFWNESPVSGAFNPSSEYSMTVSNSRAFTGKDHWISVQKTADSTRPPILNAIEIFTAQSLDEFSTTVEDGMFISTTYIS